MGEALQASTGGLHAHQQGVVDQAVGEHQAVAIGQGGYRRQVGLKAAGEEQHLLALQPGGQGGFQLLMHAAPTAHQPRGAGAHALLEYGLAGGCHQGGVGSQAQVIVAAEIDQVAPADMHMHAFARGEAFARPRLGSDRLPSGFRVLRGGARAGQEGHGHPPPGHQAP